MSIAVFPNTLTFTLWWGCFACQSHGLWSEKTRCGEVVLFAYQSHGLWSEKIRFPPHSSGWISVSVYIIVNGRSDGISAIDVRLQCFQGQSSIVGTWKICMLIQSQLLLVVSPVRTGTLGAARKHNDQDSGCGLQRPGDSYSYSSPASFHTSFSTAHTIRQLMMMMLFLHCFLVLWGLGFSNADSGWTDGGGGWWTTGHACDERWACWLPLLLYNCNELLIIIMLP